MKIFRLLLRVVVGALFVGHGTHKLFGWFGGRGIKETAAVFEQMGLRPGLPNAIAAGLAEAGGGVLVAAGYMTPLGTASTIGSMLTAMHRVHLKNGPWVTNGGYEYNLVLILSLLTLTEEGPGPLSVDAIIGQERKGTGWALASLAAAGLGAGAVHAIASAQAPTDQS
ncbi:MAG: putative oxidoreductase [Solirubrobacteraceae bacterium]|jgi:putative oxidoreductase|nr:putative oxidoreductase [Solirubrobacteraceae bacterium]